MHPKSQVGCLAIWGPPSVFAMFFFRHLSDFGQEIGRRLSSELVSQLLMSVSNISDSFTIRKVHSAMPHLRDVLYDYIKDVYLF